MVPLMLRRKANSAFSLLASFFSVVWALDTVVAGIAYHVHQRVTNFFDNTSIDFGFFALNNQLNFFVELS